MQSQLHAHFLEQRNSTAKKSGWWAVAPHTHTGKEACPGSSGATPGREWLCKGICFVPNNLKALCRLIQQYGWVTRAALLGVHASVREGGKEETPLPSLAWAGGGPREGQQREGARRPLLPCASPSDLLWGEAAAQSPTMGLLKPVPQAPISPKGRI